MNKCNVLKKKILVTSNNKFSQETVVLRKIVVQAKTLPLVIALFTVAIFFILCARKSRLYFAFGEKNKTLNYTFSYFFAGLDPPKSFSSKNWRAETDSKFSGHLSAQETLRIEVETTFVNSSIDIVTQWHSGMNKKR